MANLAKLEFVALDITGKNYLSWILDAEIHLEANALGETIKDGNNASNQDKAKAMIFLRHHLHEGLKAEYLTIKDPLVLWNNLKERYDHQKTVILPKARYDWMHLRLQDYKTVSEYNSAMFRISTQLKLCGKKLPMRICWKRFFLLFTHRICSCSSNIVKKYSQLISCLLVAEQNNELLMKNHEARSTGSAPFPEVNMTAYQPHNQIQGRGHGRGRGRGRGRSCRFGNRSGHSKNPARHLKWERNEKKDQGDSNINSIDNVCYRCGMKGHWSRTCCTPKHFVDLYKESLKRNEKRVETNVITECGTSDTQFDDFTNLDVVDFFILPEDNIASLINRKSA